MESVQDFIKSFDNVYYNKLIKLIYPLDRERKNCLRNYVISTLTMIVLIVVSARLFSVFSNVALFKENDDLLCYAVMTPIIIGIAIFCNADSKVKLFELKTKKMIMPFVLQSLPCFKQAQNSDIIDDEVIRNSDLFGTFNFKDSENNFEGEYKNVKISLAETELGEWSRHGKSRTYTKRFKGLMILLNSSITCKTPVLIKKCGSIETESAGYERVSFDNNEFAAKYSIYSKDAVEARHILTDAFMKRIDNIALAFNAHNIEVSIKDGTILLAISVNKDALKPGRIYKPVCDYSRFKAMAEELVSVLELIEELK